MTRVQDCGRVGVMPDGSARVRASGSGDQRRAGFAGLSTCGSVWACPVCAEKILARRQDEMRRALTTWTGLGGRLGFITLTMRHHQGQKLATLWDALSSAWGSVTSGRQWREDCDRYSVGGWARVVEVTHGRHGWHVHVHACVFLPSSTTAADVEHLGARMFGRWSAALVRRNMAAPLADKGGLDAQLWDAADLSDGGRLGEYFTKGEFVAQVDAGKAALELTRPDYKQGRRGNRHPFQILGDLIDNGDAADLDLWEEWETASQGRRQLTWSRGLRGSLLNEAESTDDEIAREELGSSADDLVEIPADGIRLLNLFGIHEFVLDAAEVDDGGVTLRRYLDARGIPWRDPVGAAVRLGA